MSEIQFAGNRSLDVICLGRAGVDLYAREANTDFKGDFFEQGIFPVDVCKPFGSGDSYAGTVILALIRGKSLREAVKMGSAAAAINVSKSTCTEAMPTSDELAAFVALNNK